MEYYSNYYEPQKQLPVSTGTRLASMLVDQLIMSFVAFLFYIPMFAAELFISRRHHHYHFQIPSDNWMYIGFIGMALYLCKDCFNGRSVAKRMFRLQIVDYKTGVAANPLKCLLRNLLVVIWPIEVIVILISPDRRLGDIIAGTQVVNYDATAEQSNTDLKKVLLAFVLAYLLVALLMSPARYSKQFRNMPKHEMQQDHSV